MPIVGDLLAGRYRILSPLGAGGMASVWRARDERLDREVALKVLLANLAADPALATRFDREARSLAAGSHPAIVAIHDVEPGDPSSGREPFYVMELCDGGSLADRLAAGPQPPDDVVHILAAVAEGLASLHDRGLLHRDVKPANILLCGGRPKLADFGLVRQEHVSEASALTMAGTVAGTLAYLAPELVSGQGASPASDTYALGVVAFQALTGILPRPATSMAEYVESRYVDPPHVSAAAPHLGDAFDGAVAASLAADPDARPDPLGLAADLIAALGRWRRAGGAARLAAWTAAAGVGATAAGSGSLPVDPPSDNVETGANTVVVATSAAPGRRAPTHRAAAALPAPVVLAALAGAILAAAFLSGMLGGSPDRSSPPGSVAPGASDAAEPTPAPTEAPIATPPPTPTPPPTSTPNPAGPALDAVDAVRAAIEAARQGGDLKQRDANEVRRSADEVEAALLAEDYQRARDRAERLAAQIDDLDDVDDDAHEAMQDAASALLAAIP